MSVRCSGYAVMCDLCEDHCSWEHTPSAARTAARQAGWFRQRSRSETKRGEKLPMIDVCPDCHYRQAIERQQAAERAEEWAKAPGIEF